MYPGSKTEFSITEVDALFYSKATLFANENEMKECKKIIFDFNSKRNFGNPGYVISLLLRTHK